MQQICPAPVSKSSKTPSDRLLHVLSIITILMTVPQVLSIWLNREAAGVSVIAWGAYLVSACAWLIHGIRQRDPAITLPVSAGSYWMRRS